MRTDQNNKIREWLEAFLIAVLVACVMFFVCWPMEIDGMSMENTLHNHDRVLMSRLWAAVMPFSRGDLIVCKIDEDGSAKNIIKRIVGLPGESVAISDGMVFINGLPLDEAYIKETYTSGNIDITLAEDEYFLLGDNRRVSSDSRNLGAFSRNEILGKALVRFYPFNRIELFQNPYHEGNHE